jgi:curved DNA-binding protein CbpA
VAAKSHYELLELPPTATLDEIKRAFRLQIARYHPDKVQHLGKEFQDMAAERAAELTEAYRILSDHGRRAAYDQSRSAAGPDTAAATAPAPPGPRPKTNLRRLKVRSSRRSARRATSSSDGR